MPVQIEPVSVRDYLFVFANLRVDDAREVWCQVPPGITPETMAVMAYGGPGQSYVALYRGVPVAVFGIRPLNVCGAFPWALGTSQFLRAVPSITSLFLEQLIPAYIEAGVKHYETRVLVDNVKAIAWLKRTGGFQHGEPYVFGRNDEMFVTYRWTVESFLNARDVLRRSGNDVLRLFRRGGQDDSSPGGSPGTDTGERDSGEHARRAEPT